ncbi:MAG: hypothetical protein ACRCUJ_04550 [Phocaeicola sp.]
MVYSKLSVILHLTANVHFLFIRSKDPSHSLLVSLLTLGFEGHPPPNQPASHSSAGYILHTINQFFHYNPWMRGQRNNLLLALGRRLKGKHFSQAELEVATAWVVQKYAQSDCTERHIRTRLVAGFNYAQLPPMEEKVLPQVHGATNAPRLAPEEKEEPVNVEDVNEELRKKAPYLEEKIFATLPPLLQRILTYAYTNRERDMLLMGSLATLSAALPRVGFSYFNRMQAPPLYFLAVHLLAIPFCYHAGSP